MVSRTASGGGRVGETEALRLNFASFGFFGSRLDRLCPFAIGGSPDARDQRYRTPLLNGLTVPGFFSKLLPSW
jgi:hypothetical protein